MISYFKALSLDSLVVGLSYFIFMNQHMVETLHSSIIIALLYSSGVRPFCLETLREGVIPLGVFHLVNKLEKNDLPL